MLLDVNRCCGASRAAARCLPGKTSTLFRRCVNPSLQKYSYLPKFGIDVCLAHPGSVSRGDHAVVIVASRACGGRGSVVYEMPGAGRIALREPEASYGRAALSGSSRL
nr:hypothetical protein BDOA9_0162250 [Bradyrhizobium sp. DOA9]